MLLRAASCDGNIQIADLLAKGIAIDPQDMGCLDLIPAGDFQGQTDQRPLHLTQDTVIDARRRQGIAVAGKILPQMTFDAGRQPLAFDGADGIENRRAPRQLGLDDVDTDDFLGIQSPQATDQIFEFANIARPAMSFQAVHCLGVDAFRGQPFGSGLGQEVTHIDMFRVEAKWPRLDIDILVGDIPATTGVVSDAVSFSKGCYPGQELVERMDSRGADAPVLVVSVPRDGVGVGSRVQFEGKDVGTITSIGFTVALARVARGGFTSNLK